MIPLRRVLFVVQPIVLTIAFVLIGLLLRDRWDQLWAYEWHVSPGWVLVGAVCLVSGWLIEIRLWQRLLGLVGGQLTYGPAARIWFASAIVRYVPGNVWQPLSLTMRCREQGIRPEATLASLTMLQAILLTAVGPVASIYLATWGSTGGLSRWLGSFSQWAAVLVAIPVVLFIIRPQTLLLMANFVLAKASRAPLPMGLSRDQLVRSLGLSLMSWTCFCTGFSAVSRALLPAGTPFLEALPHLAVAYPIAFVTGFLSVLTPSGLLVREGMIFLLLGPVVGQADAIVIALGIRVLEVGLEGVLGLGAIALPTIRRLGRRASTP